MHILFQRNGITCLHVWRSFRQMKSRAKSGHQKLKLNLYFAAEEELVCHALNILRFPNMLEL